MIGKGRSRNVVPSGRQALLLLGLGLAVIASLVVTSAAGVSTDIVDPESDGTVSEEAYVEPVPEPGDPYFEAAADDGSWISYENPRDEYRTPYLGEGSGKICVTLVNENGDPVVGKSVPNTSVTIPTNGVTSWHSHADPVTVQFPVTDHYEFPLDADQFGTSPNISQGDGYLDSHCVEMHGLAEDATVEYGQARINGEHADRIDVAGYIQQIPEGDGWDTDLDPVAAAEPYAQAGGGWTYREGATHAQVDVVLQLDAPADERFDPDETNSSDPEDTGSGETTNSSDRIDEHTGDGNTSGGNGDAETDSAADEGTANDGTEMPGFGVLAALVALSIAALTRYRG